MIDNNDFLPTELGELRKSCQIGFTEKEHLLFVTYGKTKNWTFSKTVRVLARAAILLEYKKANSLDEAIRKSVLLDVDRRVK